MSAAPLAGRRWWRGVAVRRSRALRLFAALFCLPVVLVVGSAGNSAAASQTLRFSFDDDTAIGADYSCETIFYVDELDGDHYGKLSEGYCGGGVDTTPGTCGSAGEPGCTDVAFEVKGTTGNGTACSVPIDVGYPTAGPHDSWSYKQIVWTGGGRYLTGCDPEEVCLTLIFSGWSSDEVKTRCTATSLDLGEVPAETDCEYGTWVGRAESESGSVTGTGSTWAVKKHYSTIMLDGVVTSGRWFPYYIMANPLFQQEKKGYPAALAANYEGEPTPPAVVVGTRRTFPTGVMPGLWGYSDGTMSLYPHAQYWEKIDLGDDPSLQTDVPVMVYENPINSHEGYWHKPVNPPYTEERQVGHEWKVVGFGIYDRNKGPASGNFEPLLPSVDSRGVFGMNDPGSCAFYWGQKLYDDPNSTVDEPAGPVIGFPDDGGEDPLPPTPPAPDPEPDAPTDDTGFLDGIWKILRELVGAVRGIASAILNGLLGLFVPSKGFFKTAADDLKDAWADTAPIVFLDSFGDVGDALNIGGPGGGCQGPDLTFSSPLDGTTQTVYPLSACSDGVSQVASLVKTALTALVYVGGVLAAVRIVGSAFGLDLSVGRGADV